MNHPPTKKMRSKGLPSHYAFMISFLVMMMGIVVAMRCYAASSDNPPKVEVKSIELDTLKNRMASKSASLVVIMMASWCPPCREEIPDLNALYDKYGRQGVEFMGVGVDEGNPDEFVKMVNRRKVTFPVYWVGAEAVNEFKLFGIPMIFLVKNGKIMVRIPGKQSRKFLDEQIQNLIH